MWEKGEMLHGGGECKDDKLRMDADFIEGGYGLCIKLFAHCGL